MPKRKRSSRIPSAQVLDFVRAAAAGNAKRVRRLLTAGSGISARSQNSAMALISATSNGHTEIVRLLLKHGVNPSLRASTIKRWGTSFEVDALGLAAEKGHLEIVQLLIQAGAKVNESINYNVDALNAAVVEGHIGIVRELIKAGYLVSGPGGEKALDAALARKREKIALLLIEAGADVRNDTAGILLNSAVKGMIRVVKALLSAGVNPRNKLFTGKTTLQSFKTIRKQKNCWDGDNKNEKIADEIQQLFEND